MSPRFLPALLLLATPLAAAPLAWDDLAQISFDRHPDIRAARLDMEIATGYRIEAAALTAPKLSVEAYTIPPLATIDLRQPLYRRGALAALEAADYGRAAAQSRFEMICEDTLFDLRLAYLEVLFLQRRREVLQLHVKTLQEALERTRSLFEAGQSRRSDSEALDVRQRLAAQNLIDVETLLAQRRLDLVQLCGLPANDPVLASGITGALDDLPAPPADTAALISRSLKERPDLRLLRALEGVEEGRVILTGAPAYPQVTLYNHAELSAAAPILGGVTRRLDEFQEELDNSRLLFGVEVRWRVFDGGKTLGAVRAARALRAQRHEILAAAERALPGQVQRSIAAINQSRALLEALPSPDQFAAQRQNALEAWNRQDIRPTELYKALDDLLALETAHLQARLDGSLASTALRRATGALVAWSLNTPRLPLNLPTSMPTHLLQTTLEWVRARPKTSLGIGAGLLILLLLPFLLLGGGQPAEISRVTRGPVTAAVYGTIEVEPVQQVVIRSRINGVIRSVNVTQGAEVKQGDILAEIVDEQHASELDQARLAHEAARERVRIGPLIASELASKKAELAQLERLLREGNIAPIEFNRVKGQVDDLQKRVDQDALTLQQALDVAKEQLDAVSTRINQGLIQAPLHGQVLDVYAQLGESVLSQSQLFLVGSRDCHLKATVNEEDVGKLQADMKAIVRLYSYSGKNFNATVREILPRGDNQSYAVLLNLTDQPPKLLPGMTGEVNIIIGRREDTLLLPTRALLNGNEVLLVRHGRVSRKPLEIGYRSIEVSEVLSGLSEGDQVILSEQDRFQPGDRVHSSKP